jgi:hypothetical protein
MDILHKLARSPCPGIAKMSLDMLAFFATTSNV